MSEADALEQGTHFFTGTIRFWRPDLCELVTDSGLSIFFTPEGQGPVPEGTRITLRAQKYRPRYKLLSIA